MVNSYLLLAQIGMILVGALAVFWWRVKTKVGWKYFAFGAAVWAVAIAVKIAMDLTFTSYISQWLMSYGSLALIAGVGLYVGLRTGLFESGFSYIAMSRTSLRKISFNQAVAFGLGFGAIEAMVIGLSGAATFIALIAMPELASSLPQASQDAFNLPTIVIFAPIMERAFTLLIHLFASLLVAYSVVSKRLNYLVVSILFKALLDGMVPVLSLLDLNTVLGIYLAELPIAALGIASLYGIKWMSKKYRSI